MAKVFQSPSEVEALITSIQGVVSCKVVIAEGHIDEVHVLADTNKSIKKLIRDVETTIKLKTEYDLDHRKISIAQIGTSEEYSSKRVRPILKGLRIELIEGYVTVSIEIDYDEITVSGEAKARGKQIDRPRLVALATLNALQKLTGSSCTFTLNQLLFISVGMHQVCLVEITANAREQENNFIGVAMAEPDQFYSAAKAVLAAINRQTHFFIQKAVSD